jgi:2-polyprenyl-6-hydroxyphenyl methylase/3-demethylubiquinone-9 3-methyltransferase
MLAHTVRTFVHAQVNWSHRIDRLLPDSLRIDGNREFLEAVVPQYLTQGAHIYDIGGGKNPVIACERKAALSLRVTGLDIDPRELSSAPDGSYDRVVCADISSFTGAGDADLVICQALLEHVADTESALRAIASILRPGGRALVFVPSRNAVYARLNMILPEGLKRAILFGIYPEMMRDHGFPAYYDRCTPAEFDEMARLHGLVREDRRLYFQSDYFRFCIPMHLLWRTWVVLFRAMAGATAAETFTLVLRKEG